MGSSLAWLSGDFRLLEDTAYPELTLRQHLTGYSRFLKQLKGKQILLGSPGCTRNNRNYTGVPKPAGIRMLPFVQISKTTFKPWA